MPVRMPTGSATSAVRPIRITVPWIAFAIPPIRDDWVRNVGVRAGAPRTNASKRMLPSGRRASATHSKVAPLMMTSNQRRRVSRSNGNFIPPPPPPAGTGRP